MGSCSCSRVVGSYSHVSEHSPISPRNECISYVLFANECPGI